MKVKFRKGIKGPVKVATANGFLEFNGKGPFEVENEKQLASVLRATTTKYEPDPKTPGRTKAVSLPVFELVEEAPAAATEKSSA